MNNLEVYLKECINNYDLGNVKLSYDFEDTKEADMLTIVFRIKEDDKLIYKREYKASRFNATIYYDRVKEKFKDIILSDLIMHGLSKLSDIRKDPNIIVDYGED